MALNKKKVTWTKMSGAGNSFWITHFLSSDFAFSKEINWQTIAIKLCRLWGGDGVAILGPSRDCDFKWLFFNADGSQAEMCGNLACCVTEYVFVKKLLPLNRGSFKERGLAQRNIQRTHPQPLSPPTRGGSFTLETRAGKIKGVITSPFDKDLGARVFLKQSQSIGGPFTFRYKGEDIAYMFINSGVPHAVIGLKGSGSLPFGLRGLAQALRKSLRHDKNGMNVSFWTEFFEPSSKVFFPKCVGVVVEQPDFVTLEKSRGVKLLACSFERGVEDWTLACGTGALAIAQVYIHSLRFGTGEQSTNSDAPFVLADTGVLVQMPGGLLRVEFHDDHTVSLRSPVKWLEERTENLSLILTSS